MLFRTTFFLLLIVALAQAAAAKDKSATHDDHGHGEMATKLAKLDNNLSGLQSKLQELISKYEIQELLIKEANRTLSKLIANKQDPKEDSHHDEEELPEETEISKLEKLREKLQLLKDKQTLLPRILFATEEERTQKFFEAVSKGHISIVHLLISTGFNLETLHSNYNRTGLLIAVDKGQNEVVSTLIAAGANVNATDPQLLTPLHLAVLRANEAIIDVLIAANADLQAQDELGLTPKDLAELKKLKKIVRKLEAAAKNS